MNLHHRAVAILLFCAVVSPAFAGNETERLVRRHPVWMQAKLTWDRDPGEPNQDFAGGRILYFGENKKFGFFSGIVLRQSGRLALSEGEGGNVYSGTWNADSDGIWVDYRLVHSYKVSQLKGEKPPEIPGPLKHASILLERSEDGRIGEIQQLHLVVSPMKLPRGSESQNCALS
jgi:hypothetical protein